MACNNKQNVDCKVSESSVVAFLTQPPQAFFNDQYGDRLGQIIFLRGIPLFAAWLYVSSSLLGPNADADILDIRRAAATRNADLGLTGVLIFSGHHFAQFLEGSERCLETMKTSICGDARHTGIVTLQSSLVATRRYSRWTLAYSGQAACIDEVLSNAARDRNPTELLRYMDQFAS